MKLARHQRRTLNESGRVKFKKKKIWWNCLENIEVVRETIKSRGRHSIPKFDDLMKTCALNGFIIVLFKNK